MKRTMPHGDGERATKILRWGHKSDREKIVSTTRKWDDGIIHDIGMISCERSKRNVSKAYRILVDGYLEV